MAKPFGLMCKKANFPMYSKKSRSILLTTLAMILYSIQLVASDTIESVIARMKTQTATKIAYTETRDMGLFSDTWQATGVLYAQPPNIMLKQQQQPTVEIMAIEAEQLYYHKPATDTFHQMQFDENNAMMSSIIIFKGLMTGDSHYLRQFYALSIKNSPQDWSLLMEEKNPDIEREGLKITIQGLPEQAAHSIRITLPDGDEESYALSPAEHSPSFKQLNVLLNALKSH